MAEEKKRIRTFEEWVADLDESKKGIVPDFISEKLKTERAHWKEVETETQAGKNKKWRNDGVDNSDRPPVDKGSKEKKKGKGGVKTGEGKREKE